MKLSKTKVFYFTLLLLFQVNVFSQTKLTIDINWDESTENKDNSPSDYSFENAFYKGTSSLPFYANQFEVNSYGDLKIDIINIISEEISLNVEDNVPSSLEITSHIVQERKKFHAQYSFLPFIRNSNTGRIERVLKVEFTFRVYPLPIAFTRGGPEFKSTSVLNEGDIYKISVSESGIHKITSSELQEMGINISSLNPDKIQIFGNPGGMNPEENSELQYDDLEENSLFIQGGGDGSFDGEDFILFYAHGPEFWNKDGYVHNLYDDQNYYFIRIASQDGSRITERENTAGPIYSTNFDTYKRYEIDAYNLLSDFASTQGSGKLWFSEKYSSNRTQDFSSLFSDANLDLSEEVSFDIQFASRSQNSTRLNLLIDGTENQVSFSGVNVSNIESRYADLERRIFAMSLSSTSPQVILDYPQGVSESEGWLDYIHMNYRSKLNYSGEPISFRNFDSETAETFGFQIQSNTENIEIWDITNPSSIKKQLVDNLSFAYNSTGVHEFVVFETNGAHKSVEFIEKIANQNLHAITSADALIIYHPDFQEEAERLATHRAEHSDLSVLAVPVGMIYNEFSSGRVDVPAIRNFARMIYERDPNFRFLTLFGDGSFDYKHIETDFNDDSYVPVYETNESLSPIIAFPSDDFYGLLNIQEGGNLKGGLDLGIGRIPVQTAVQARQMVDKIINYDTNSETFADWRLRLGFASDDEDSNIHVRDADGIAENTRLNFKDFNIEKIYFDAYPQVSTPGGERYPLASSALNNNIFKGMLTLCYLGHGGPTGWAQERVLQLADIEKWDNENKLPLMVTATCSFTGYDSPKITSAGEQVFLKEKTGAIALMSTVRAVYVNQNERLTRAVFDTIFTKDAGEFMGLGEILRRAKNSNAADTIDVNARKFQLIGDPSLKLAIPDYQIVTSKINGVDIDENYRADTTKALQKMTFEGYVTGSDGYILQDFNGIAYASVFDKLIQSKTLGNNASSSERVFNIQKTVLFKGQSAVENGRFSFEFYLPADINFEYGNGKISLYATNGNIDASGSFEDFIIGGSEGNSQDDSPPLVDVFLNTEDFVFGGLSNSDPILLVKLQDDFGINVAGVSVGHDLVAELDNNSKESYILNDFYEAELNDFRRGTVRFPLEDIEAGKHTLKIKAWDLSNNLGEGYTEFIVSDDLGESLQHVLNYPNPFSTRTNFMFEHNLPGAELDILINIYNMSGQIVKTIESINIDEGFRIDNISWDGQDDYGQKIANGVYLYKIKVTANQLGISKESNFEKLVILK